MNKFNWEVEDVIFEDEKYLAAILVKHLQGQHDQSTHGRRGSNVSESRNDDSDFNKQEQKDMTAMVSHVLMAGRLNTPFQIYSANKNKIDLVNQSIKVMNEKAIDNLASRIFFKSKYWGKYTWAGDNIPKKIKQEFIDKAKNELRKEIKKRIEDNFTGIRKDKVQKTVDNLAEEAKSSFDNKSVYRGMIIDKKLYSEIKDSIEKTGKYMLDVMPVSSYTEDEKLAIRFAKAGQRGGSAEIRVGHIVYSQLADSRNVLLHSKQKTFKDLQTSKSKIKFHIGGYDQKEVLLDHRKSKILLTKENISQLWYE